MIHFRRQLLIAIAASLTIASPAAAGEYIHVSCSAEARGTERWTAFKTAPGNAPRTTTSNGCAQGGVLRADVVPEYTISIPPTLGAGWRYDAPAESSIARVRFSIYGWVDTLSGQVGSARLDVGGIELHNWSSPGVFTQGVDLRPTNDPRDVKVDAVCATGCQAGWPLGWFEIKGARMTLRDSRPPTGALDDQSVPTGSVGGSIRIAGTAADEGAGIREIRLRADGAAVWRKPVDQGTCVPLAAEGETLAFSSPTPCPGSLSFDEAFDTNQLADGSHAASFEVVDAAGNVTQISRFSLVVANHPPVNHVPPSILPADRASAPEVGVALVGEPGSWGGPDLQIEQRWQRCAADGTQCVDIADATHASYTPTTADGGRRLRFAVTARNVVALTRYSAITGVVGGGLQAASDDTNGRLVGGACRDDAYVLRALGTENEVVRVRRSNKHRATVRAELVCAADGRPVRAASLRVTLRRAGAEEPVGSLVETGSDGVATLSLPATASRTVSFTYRLRDNDPIPRASLVVRLAVRNSLTLSVQQRGTIARFRGRVTGGHVPPRGVSVQLQWKDGTRWRPVANLRTDRTGRFRYTYRFSSRGRGFRYAFRAVVTPGQVDYPFVPARSAVRRTGPR